MYIYIYYKQTSQASDRALQKHSSDSSAIQAPRKVAVVAMDRLSSLFVLVVSVHMMCVCVCAPLLLVPSWLINLILPGRGTCR